MSDFGFLDIWFCSSWLIGTACVLHLIIRYARKFVHVTVNCWFCNNNSKVPLIKKNEWHCMHCDQFNGFDKDGSYIKEIPEQYNENLNSFSKSCVSNRGIKAKSNGLCRICNANQELKIKQLAVYEPFRERNYDQEIEWFKQRLEKSYKLCSICEKTVENTLKLKGNLYAKTCNQKYFVNEEGTADSVKTKQKWIAICAVVFAVLIMASFWKYSTKFDFLKNELLLDILNADLSVLSRDYGIFINIFSIACITAFLKMRRPHGRIFGYPLILGILFYGLRDYLPVALKISAMVLFIGYCIISWWKRKAACMKFKKLNEGFKNRFMELDEDTKSVSDDNICSSSAIVGNPLCGKFSNLTLGRSSTVASAKNVPYLFRSTKSIIQPSRLKLDDSDKCESPRTSPSTSSGYESVSNFLKRSPDSISEFDSISQVGVNGRNYSFEMKNRFYQKVDNVFETSPDKRLCTLAGEPNMIAPYLYSRNQCFAPSERYYGVSPSPSPQQSQVPANTIFSTIQIILCSMAFFILGFCFQLVVNKFLS